MRRSDSPTIGTYGAILPPPHYHESNIRSERGADVSCTSSLLLIHDGDCITAEAFWHDLVGEKDGLANALCLGTEYKKTLVIGCRAS
jgi:hypothetical protein